MAEEKFQGSFHASSLLTSLGLGQDDKGGELIVQIKAIAWSKTLQVGVFADACSLLRRSTWSGYPLQEPDLLAYDGAGIQGRHQLREFKNAQGLR
jgi:hypothetical protein